jgi:RNA-directed DNA polymerase
VVEEDQSQGPKITRNRKGTPQGGVISPLLANVYLHWFEKAFYSEQGPGNWAKARIVRYADDFAVFARYQGSRIRGFIEEKIESWLGLEINRDKTKVVDLYQPQASFDFLGFTFRYDRDLKGRNWNYLNVTPSKKAIKAEQEKLRNLVNRHQSHVPIPELIKIVNRQLTGWAGYFSFGYPRKEMRRLNSYIRRRLTRHLKRRSQRPFRPPEGRTFYKQLKYLGLIYL